MTLTAGPTLTAQRRLTAAFVARAPEDVALSRATLSDDGEGGLAEVRSQVPEQTFTFCESSSSGYGPPSVASDGARTLVDVMLVGAWDTDLRERDEFARLGGLWRVGVVLPDNGWERRAYVTRVGDAP